MGLRLKFNLMLLVVFLAGFATIGIVAKRYLENQAIDDAQRAAMVVLDAAGYAKLDPRIASGLGSRLVDMKIREFSPDDSLRGVEAQVALRLKSNGSGQMTEVITAATGERRLAVARTFRAADTGAATIRLANIDLAPIIVTVNLALTTLMSTHLGSPAMC